MRASYLLGRAYPSLERNADRISFSTPKAVPSIKLAIRSSPLILSKPQKPKLSEISVQVTMSQ